MPAVPASRRPRQHRQLARRGAALFGAACSGLAIAAATAAAATPCAPPGEQRSASLTRADRADGTSEVTESLAGGGYRVTRCAKDGSLLVSQTVSPIADPDGGVALVPTERETPGAKVSMLYGDPAEPTWAAAFRAGREALRASVIPPTAPLAAAPVAPPAQQPAVHPAAEQADPSNEPSPAGAPERSRPAPGGQRAQAAVSGDACTNAQYALWFGVWSGRHYWYYVNRSRFNYNDTSVASVVRGHTNWDATRNGCALNDITNLNSHHVGSTSATIHSYPDGVSVTDRGNLASVGCAGALACTWLFTNNSGVATETDQRFSDTITFSNVGAAGAYDYQSVSTHESGHGIGLDHANSSDALTMHYTIRSGTTHARSLAKGDVMGLRRRYP